MATQAQFERLTRLKESAIDGGARVVAEAGLDDERDQAGWWVTPTLFADVPAKYPLARSSAPSA